MNSVNKIVKALNIPSFSTVLGLLRRFGARGSNILFAKDYRPIVFKLSDRIYVNPYVLFIVLFAGSFLIQRLPFANLTNSLAISFMIAYLTFFKRYPQLYLDKLKSSLEISDKEFQCIRSQIGHYSFLKFGIVSLMAPLLYIAVNFRNPSHFFNSSNFLTISEHLPAELFAIFTGMLILQMNYITISEVYRFNIIAKKYAKVDLLDIHKLDPFSHIGVLAAMSIIGLYSVIPFSLIKEPELLYSLINSFVISIPFLLLNIGIPLYRVYKKINDKLVIEKKLIRKVLDVDNDAKTKLALFQHQKNINTLDIIGYRTYINSISPIPIAKHNVASFLSSLLFLIGSWLLPALL